VQSSGVSADVAMRLHQLLGGHPQALGPSVQTEVGRALHGKSCSESTFTRLKGAGFLRGVANAPKPRCELYGAFLGPHFIV
jgi:hypothetical protein